MWKNSNVITFEQYLLSISTLKTQRRRLATGTCGVVCACVEYNDGLVWRIAQVLHEAGEVQPLLLRVPVTVLVQPSKASIPVRHKMSNFDFFLHYLL